MKVDITQSHSVKHCYYNCPPSQCIIIFSALMPRVSQNIVCAVSLKHVFRINKSTGLTDSMGLFTRCKNLGNPPCRTNEKKEVVGLRDDNVV